jgi:xanthine dehydrogenase YagS FAD-binding subunit
MRCKRPMRPFEYTQARDLAEATRLGSRTGQGQTNAAAQFLAGGTTLVDLMKLDVLRPSTVIDLRALRTSGRSGISARSDGLHLSAFATMAAVADDPEVGRLYPLIAQSLKLAASAQIRNMATLGGNVLQRTRCPFFRDPSWQMCNKRSPGSGCQAIGSFNRNHAILGTDSSCIAQYPGDFGVALIALDASLEITGPQGSRRLPFAQLHLDPAMRPDIENSLHAGELITAFLVPAGPWTARSLYLKVRDRSSYEFAISSCAVAMALDGDAVRSVRLGLGGMAYRPWRAHEAEAILSGKPLTEPLAREAATAAIEGAITHGHNDYKRELAKRVIVRALLEAKSMAVPAAGTMA